MKKACLALLWVVLAALCVLRAAPAAAAPFQPPPLQGHVVDATGTLAPAQAAELNARLDAFRQQTGYAVVAFIVPSLEGRTIDDVAYETFNTWKIGEQGKDTGVLLVLAPAERRSRIETGKGVGGELTDLESIEILRKHVTPAMKEGDLFGAVDAGTRAIQATLVKDAAGQPRPEAAPQQPAPAPWYSKWLLMVGVLVVGLLAIVSPAFRFVLFALLQSLIFSRGGGGGRGGIGGGYSGGGGRSGGGGASDGY